MSLFVALTPWICAAASLGICIFVLAWVLVAQRQPARRTERQAQALKHVPASTLDQARRLVRERKPLLAVRVLEKTSEISRIDARAYVDAVSAAELGGLALAQVLTVELACEVRDEVSRGQRRKAVSLLVSRIGAAQAEAVRLVELLVSTRDNRGWLARRPLPETAGDTGLERIRVLVAAGEKAEAVRLYRTFAGASLKEAKDYVDALAAR